MDDTKALKKEYYGAQKELEQLEAELPNYESLLADNERAESERRRIKASLDEIAQAKTRVQAARELLEQHRSDIAAARAEANRLEGEYRHALTLDTMAKHVQEAAAHRAAFDEAMHGANEALGPLVRKLTGAWQAWNKARADFADTGRQLSKGFGYTQWPPHLTNEREERARLQGALDDLAVRVELTDVLSPHNGRCTVADLEHFKPLASPEPFGPLVWKGLQKVWQQQEFDAAMARRDAEMAARRETRDKEALTKA